MNVHITCTPEYSTDKLDEIVSLLSSIPGELKFFKENPLTEAQFRRLFNKDIHEIDSLNFDEYFDLVQGHRELKEIKDEDFIILISTIRNNKDWFSAFNKRNVFIYGDEWDIISDADSKFGIAYQCVENIFQSLSELDIINYKNDPNIHLESIGCINDFCDHKPDIIKKFQSANICDSCLNRILDMKFKYEAIHILTIIEEIRKEFVASRHLRSITKLEKVRVNEKGDIYIGDKYLQMEVIPKVLYIGFLQHLSGLPSNKLCENKTAFEKIYRELKTKNRDDDAIHKLLCKRVEKQSTKYNLKPTFETNRTRIKNALLHKLGAPIANHYIINYLVNENNQKLFKIPLSNELVELHSTFAK